jgi:glycosyltransferase involved in cell wall biosynthesis
MGWQSDEIIRQYYRRAKALVFPGEEDFGIVPVEMQACGGFVLALGKGGALETVKDGKTGLFFQETSERSIVKTVERFEKMHMDSHDARLNALSFGRERFKKEIRDAVARVAQERGKEL